MRTRMMYSLGFLLFLGLLPGRASAQTVMPELDAIANHSADTSDSEKAARAIREGVINNPSGIFILGNPRVAPKLGFDAFRPFYVFVHRENDRWVVFRMTFGSNKLSPVPNAILIPAGDGDTRWEASDFQWETNFGDAFHRAKTDLIRGLSSRASFLERLSFGLFAFESLERVGQITIEYNRISPNEGLLKSIYTSRETLRDVRSGWVTTREALNQLKNQVRAVTQHDPHSEIETEAYLSMINAAAKQCLRDPWDEELREVRARSLIRALVSAKEAAIVAKDDALTRKITNVLQGIQDNAKKYQMVTDPPFSRAAWYFMDRLETLIDDLENLVRGDLQSIGLPISLAAPEKRLDPRELIRDMTWALEKRLPQNSQASAAGKMLTEVAYGQIRDEESLRLKLDGDPRISPRAREVALELGKKLLRFGTNVRCLSSVLQARAQAFFDAGVNEMVRSVSDNDLFGNIPDSFHDVPKYIEPYLSPEQFKFVHIGSREPRPPERYLPRPGVSSLPPVGATLPSPQGRVLVATLDALSGDLGGDMKKLEARLRKYASSGDLVAIYLVTSGENLAVDLVISRINRDTVRKTPIRPIVRKDVFSSEFFDWLAQEANRIVVVDNDSVLLNTFHTLASGKATANVKFTGINPRNVQPIERALDAATGSYVASAKKGPALPAPPDAVDTREIDRRLSWRNLLDEILLENTGIPPNRTIPPDQLTEVEEGIVQELHSPGELIVYTSAPLENGRITISPGVPIYLLVRSPARQSPISIRYVKKQSGPGEISIARELGPVEGLWRMIRHGMTHGGNGTGQLHFYDGQGWGISNEFQSDGMFHTRFFAVGVESSSGQAAVTNVPKLADAIQMAATMIRRRDKIEEFPSALRGLGSEANVALVDENFHRFRVMKNLISFADIINQIRSELLNPAEVIHRVRLLADAMFNDNFLSNYEYTRAVSNALSELRRESIKIILHLGEMDPAVVKLRTEIFPAIAWAQVAAGLELALIEHSLRGIVPQRLFEELGIVDYGKSAQGALLETLDKHPDQFPRDASTLRLMTRPRLLLGR